MPRPNKYSDEQRAEVLTKLQLNGGNIAKTSRETGIPSSTLERWQNRSYNAAVLSGKPTPYSVTPSALRKPTPINWVDRWASVQDSVTQHLLSLIPFVESAREAAAIAAIASDRYLDHAVGRKSATTVNVPVDNRQLHLQLAAGMDNDVKRSVLDRARAMLAQRNDDGTGTGH